MLRQCHGISRQSICSLMLSAHAYRHKSFPDRKRESGATNRYLHYRSLFCASSNTTSRDFFVTTTSRRITAIHLLGRRENTRNAFTSTTNKTPPPASLKPGTASQNENRTPPPASMKPGTATQRKCMIHCLTQRMFEPYGCGMR